MQWVCMRYFLKVCTLVLAHVGHATASSEGIPLPGETLANVIGNSPSVIRALRDVEISDWRIRERISEKAPKVDFSTTGKYPLTENINESRARASDLDENYLDALVSTSKTVFDWGRVDARILAERSRRVAAEDAFEIVFEEELRRLLVLSIDQISLKEQLTVLTQDLAFIDVTLEALTRRYRQGAGSIDEIRTLELRRIDIEREFNRLSSQLDQGSDTLKRVFRVEFQDIEPSVVAVLNELPRPDDVILEEATLRLRTQSDATQRALGFDVISLRAEKKPAVVGTLTTRLYNAFTDPFDEYEIYGGINISFPLFDGGARNARIEGLRVQQTLEQDRLAEELAAVEEQWIELEAREKTFLSEREQDEIRLDTFEARLETLKQRMSAVQVTLLEIADVELARSQAARSILAADWGLKSVAVQKAELADRLRPVLSIEQTE